MGVDFCKIQILKIQIFLNSKTCSGPKSLVNRPGPGDVLVESARIRQHKFWIL
jgi:hypothetical protein